MEGFRFSTDVRVRFAETDAQRIAHNATYLVWFEVARVAYLDEFTAGYRAFQDAGTRRRSSRRTSATSRRPCSTT